MIGQAGETGDVVDEERPAGWRDWRRLLHGPFRVLVGGQWLGQAGDGLAQITFAQVALFEVGSGASPWELTKLLAATLLPFSIVGPLAGILIDRWDRRRTMVVVSTARVAIALAAIGVLVLDSQPLALAGVLVLLSASRFVAAAKGAALPRTVDATDLVAANALASIGGMVAAFGAAVIGATFVEGAPAAGFIVAAVLYAGSAISFGRLPPVGGGEGDSVSVGWARLRHEIADQVRAVTEDAAVRRPMLAVWTHRLLLGFGFILLVLIADSRYRFEASGYGLALAVTGVGAFLGTWSAPVLGRRFRPTGLIPLTFLAAGLVATVAGFRPDFGVLVAGVGLVAMAFQVLKILADALIQHAAPDVVRGRVVSIYDTGYNVAFVLAGLALVPLWDPGREQALLWALAGGFTVAGLLFARALATWPAVTASGAVGPNQPRPRPWPRRRWPARLAAPALGVVPVLAFPEVNWWPLGFIGLVPLLALVARAPTGREAGVLGWLGGTGFAVAMHHWLLGSVGRVRRAPGLRPGPAVGALGPDHPRHHGVPSAVRRGTGPRTGHLGRRRVHPLVGSAGRAVGGAGRVAVGQRAPACPRRGGGRLARVGRADGRQRRRRLGLRTRTDRHPAPAVRGRVRGPGRGRRRRGGGGPPT